MEPEHAWCVFTDGSASVKDRSGGWAWVAISEDGIEEEGSDGESDTSIGRMELTAAARALEGLWLRSGPSLVLLYSDSKYVVNGVNLNQKRKVNKDVWEQLDRAIEAHVEVRFEHVKGHNGDEYNERADKLAGEARLLHLQG